MFASVVGVALLVPVGVFGHDDEDPAGPASSPVVFAHRGGAELYPENTLGAFRGAHADFEDVWLELDAQLSKDGVFVVIHDQTLDRTTNCEGSVRDRTASELQGCDAAVEWSEWGFEPVPTAEEVLEEGKGAGWRILFELKTIPTERNFEQAGADAALALVELVDAVGFPLDRLIVQSFWPLTLDIVKLGLPGISTALLTTSQLPGAPPGVGFYASQNALYSKARGYDIVAPDHTSPDLTEHTVASIQSLGLGVVVWTVDDSDDIARAIGWGVNGIISDRPDLVYQALQS